MRRNFTSAFSYCNGKLLLSQKDDRTNIPAAIKQYSLPSAILILQQIFDNILLYLGPLFDKVDLIKPVSNNRPYVQAYIRPSVHKKFLRFQWNLACTSRSMSDARRYAAWPNPRSRSQALQSCKSGRFQKLSPLPFTMEAGNWPRILKQKHNI